MFPKVIPKPLKIIPLMRSRSIRSFPKNGEANFMIDNIISSFNTNKSELVSIMRSRNERSEPD